MAVYGLLGDADDVSDIIFEKIHIPESASQVLASLVIRQQCGCIPVIGRANDESDINFVKFQIPEGAHLFSIFLVLIMAKRIYKGC